MAKRRSPPRNNQITRHPEKVAIEMARVAGVSLDKIAETYGVHRDAIWRHMDTLPDSYKRGLIADVPREELVRRAVEEGGLLLDHFKLIRNLAEGQLILAKACGDSHAVANLTRAAIQANREVGKFTGEIERLSAPGVTINNNVTTIVETPEYRVLQDGLVDLARDHPAVKDDVLALLRRVQAPMIEGRATPLIEGHAHA